MDIARKIIHHGGTEARRVLIRVGVVLLACCLATGMQDAKKVTNTDGQPVRQSAKIIDAKPQVVPITQEEHHHLVLENDYVRVFHVEVAPHVETKYHQHDMDYVFVTLGDSVVENDRVGEKPVKLELKDGDTRFTKGGFAHKAVNLSDKPFVNVTVELKKNTPFDKCENCIDETLQTTTDTSRVYHEEILSSENGVVYKWRISGKFKEFVDRSMPRDFLLVPLTNFRLSGDKHSYKVGEAIWKTGGTYHWATESDARFITIEFGPCSMKRGPYPNIAVC
jgi:quercetin dioxygenase-like cupin family protein